MSPKLTKQVIKEFQKLPSRKRIRKVMTFRGWGDQELAVFLGVSRQSVSAMLNGHTALKLSRVMKIAEALGVAPSILI